MYVIKYDRNDIYAGFWSNNDGSYCYNSNFTNKKKPKVFKTKKGAENHIMSLIDKVPYPNEHNFRIEEWTDQDLENHLKAIGIKPFKEMEKSKNNRLHDFIKAITSNVDENCKDGDFGDFRFDLLRWSKDQPFWCVFACEHKENTTIVTKIEDVISIGGHYCIGTNEGLHDVLSILADSGWKVEIHSWYFNDSED